MILLFKLFKFCLAVALIAIAFYLRTPFLAGLRNELFWVVLICSLGLFISENVALKKDYYSRRIIISFLTLTFASLSFFKTVVTETHFVFCKRSVLNENINNLAELGQHFIVGYRNFEEAQRLVERKAISGIFITARNIKDKTKAEVKQEIQALQAIRVKQGLSPLWIATDQEGGIVSRLSPPLSKLPQLSKVIDETKKIEDSKDAVVQYARIQGRELSELGINLNFAPVVDLNKGIVSPEDKFSKIYQRAISKDKEVVAKVALWYCQTLEEYRVSCTIKHFPGLGRVHKDTHITHADLTTSVNELTRDDWVPFREVMRHSQAVTMLGHAKLTTVDDEYPVSFSKLVVTEIIRKAWQHEGILITDDFSMGAVYSSKYGLGGATVNAINAGVDLILIAYDQDLYYEAMSSLLKAERSHTLDKAILDKSQKRLEQAKKSILRA
jgi:beta-N-acetylhexosaminidase